MITYETRYAGPSGLRDGALSLSTNERRPVRFHARVARHLHPLKLALQSLGELVWSDLGWLSLDEFQERLELTLDPVITVHPDRVFFEAFSQDESAYGVVIVDRDVFEDDGAVSCGTTNVDFTRGLHQALGDMRSGAEARFHVGSAGFAVESGSGGAHFEAKVDLPDSWVRGFLQLQGAMAMPGTRFDARPVDVLRMIRYLARHKARSAPRSVRYEFTPGAPVRAVLEPWEHPIELVGADHNYTTQKITRTWGRRRLSLLEPMLPWAQIVEVYLKGRALPSFYAVRLPGVTFVLGLSGWVANHWSQTASFDLLAPTGTSDLLTTRAVDLLRREHKLGPQAAADALAVDVRAAHAALADACRLGMAIYDVRDREFRHRELFETPIDPVTFYPPDPRKVRAAALAASVVVTANAQRDKRVGSKVFTDRVLDGAVDGHTAHAVIKDTGQLIFGRCTCPFFDENLMAKGPCEHMLALRLAAAAP